MNEKENLNVDAILQGLIKAKCDAISEYSKARIQNGIQLIIKLNSLGTIMDKKGGYKVNNDKWITIDFKNGEVCHYRPEEYTDYQYDGKYFIVIYEKQWIGMYNLKEIRYIEIASVEDAERGNTE